MARHRNVRNMNFDDDYEGYNDVYGHSVEDNYCVSPSASQYLYNRGEPNQISAFFSPEGADIQEEPDEEDKSGLHKVTEGVKSMTLESAIADLVPEEEILLRSCLEEIQLVMGDSTPEGVIISEILRAKFNVEKALDACLRGATEPEHTTKEVKLQTRRDDRNIGTQGRGLTGDKRTDQRDTFSERTPVKTTADIGGKSAGHKVVPASKGSVTVGFELPRKENVKDSRFDKDNLSVHSSDSKNSSKAPSPVPPEERKEETVKSSKTKEFKPELALTEYAKQRGLNKDLLSLLVIGHVDAGKSTLMGHLLWQLGQVSKKTMHKFEQDSKKLGKQSFMYAWVLDETGEERSRGITMDVGQSKFETETKTIVLLDAPGHKDFIPNMITGASQADAAILVVDATKGEFETGFESGGQTREHTLLSRSLGVSQLIIAVNKLDTVGWAQARFEDIKARLTTFLVKQANYRENDTTFIPCSGLIGQNLTVKSTEELLNNWYTGPTLLEAIDSLRPPDRPVGKPLRLSVNDVFKGSGSFCISGRVETGMIQAGDKVLVQPIGEIANVKSVTSDNESGAIAFAGDPVIVALHNISDTSVLAIGCVLSDPSYPSRVSSRFLARIVTFDAMTIPLVKGFTGVMHLGSLAEQVVLKKLINAVNKGSGEVSKVRPRCFGKNSSGLVELETAKPICMEEFKDVKELGRFTLRSAGVTIAAGVITQIF